MSYVAKKSLQPTFFVSMVSLALSVLNVFPSQSYADFLTGFGSGANQFTMTFVPIGNPGNAADTSETYENGNANLPSYAGSVGYRYNMSKYEVSRNMIDKANAIGNLGITLHDMSMFGGNVADNPATGISWNEAARFVNWLNTSQGYSAAYKFSIQPGQVGYDANANIEFWLPSDVGYDATNLFRNSQAHYFLPSMDEWYKAAYFDPNMNNGAGGYWRFPTGSNEEPIPVAGGTNEGTAVYKQTLTAAPPYQGPAGITNAGGLSKYGVMGLGGNVQEWNESPEWTPNLNPSSFRNIRGGWWYHSDTQQLAADYFYSVNPDFADSVTGFRVASVPEPSSAFLLLVCSAGALSQRKKRIC